MYFNNAEWVLSKIYPSLTWSRPTEGKNIFLTFDDGPIPDVTEWVLEILKQYQISATFFCVGGNIEKNPGVFRKVLEAGHKAGNHTFNHINGWKNENNFYLDNIEKCMQFMRDNSGELHEAFLSENEKILFRPPYGKIGREQIHALRDQYEIVMWNVLTGDFNKELSAEKCLSKSIKYTHSGSIVIFHDSIKAERNLRYVLPRYIEHFLSHGYNFRTL